MPVSVEQPASLGRARFHGACEVGAFSYFNGVADVFHTVVGRYCSIAPGVIIGPGEHPIDHLSTHPFAWGGGGRRFHGEKAYQSIRKPGGSSVTHQATTIGSDVWIGARAYIAQGVTIGHGSVVAASAVVTKDVLPYSIVGGVPARVLRMRFDQDLIDRLLALSWWEYDLSSIDIQSFDLGDIRQTVEQLEQCAAEGRLKSVKIPRKKLPRQWLQRSVGVANLLRVARRPFTK